MTVRCAQKLKNVMVNVYLTFSVSVLKLIRITLSGMYSVYEMLISVAGMVARAGEAKKN